MALKPGTSIEGYAELLPELDMVLIMTVEPGFWMKSVTFCPSRSFTALRKL